MIARCWKGIAKPEHAASYVAHLSNETFPALETIDGFVRASVGRREVERGIEFFVVTVWSSLDAIRAFAGDAIEKAVVPDVVQAMMADFDRNAVHYEIIEIIDRP